MRLKLLVPLGQVQERWQHDRQLFLSKVKSLGVDASLHATSFVLASQTPEAERSLLQGVDVMVVISPLAVSPAPIVEMAHKSGVPVVAYDRLIMDCPLALYVSFDNAKVGELQASHLVRRKPQGNYVLVSGPPSDHNSLLYREGQMRVLQPLIDRGEIRIVEDQAAKDWLPTEAYRIVKEALNKTDGQLDAVLATNDGLAEGALQALAERNLERKVPVTGQDAELPACQRIVAGTQSMTVYKPIKLLAETAAEAAVALAKKQMIGFKTTALPNGRGNVPSILLSPIPVDKDNLEETVIADGFQKREEVFP